MIDYTKPIFTEKDKKDLWVDSMEMIEPTEFAKEMTSRIVKQNEMILELLLKPPMAFKQREEK